jgi:hypothetical protein
MRRISIIGIAAVSLLLGTTARAYAQHEQQGDNQKQEQRDDKKDIRRVMLDINLSQWLGLQPIR